MELMKVDAKNATKHIEKQLIIAIYELYIRDIINCETLEEMKREIRRLTKEIIKYQEKIKDEN